MKLVPNKLTKEEIKALSRVDVARNLAMQNVDLVQEIWAQIARISNPTERVDRMLNLLEFCAPKMSRIKVTVNEDESTIDVVPEKLDELWTKANSVAMKTIR